MQAIDKFEPRDTTRQYGSYSYYVTITSAVKNIEKVLGVIVFFEGKNLPSMHMVSFLLLFGIIFY